MSKDAKKKAARNENFKDAEIVRLKAELADFKSLYDLKSDENERHVKLWHETQLRAIERAGEIDTLKDALVKSGEAVSQLLSEVEGLKAAPVLHQIQEPAQA